MARGRAEGTPVRILLYELLVVPDTAASVADLRDVGCLCGVLRLCCEALIMTIVFLEVLGFALHVLDAL